MSLVANTISDIQLKRMSNKLNLFEAMIAAAEPCFELSGRGLEEVCKRHAQDLMTYDQALQECKTVEDIVRMKLEEKEGHLYKKYNENHQRALGQRDIGQYIKGDPEYVEIYEIILEIVHVRRKLESIVEALKSMGWSISNIVKLRIAQLEYATL
jgi:hypothetical protein